MSGQALLQVDGLVKRFAVGHGLRGRHSLVAVDDVTFEVEAGETVGVVGESGCGKSTLARCLSRLERVTAGSVRLQGRDITRMSRRKVRALRRDVQMVFQDPYDSLNPRRSVGASVAEPMIVHHLATRAEARREAGRLFEIVGLNPRHLDRYPHEFSGGQRQRIGVARALATKPRLLIADEPVSALDVSVQAQVLNLLADLQAEFGLTYVFISHNLDVVRYMADRVVVMYLGQVMELAPAELLHAAPAHPYTVSLLAAVPGVADGLPGGRRERIILRGDVPSPINRPPACPFEPRCPVAQPRCAVEKPPLEALPDGRYVACHYPFSLALAGGRQVGETGHE